MNVLSCVVPSFTNKPAELIEICSLATSPILVIAANLATLVPPCVMSNPREPKTALLSESFITFTSSDEAEICATFALPIIAPPALKVLSCVVPSFIENELELISNGVTIIHSHTLEHLYEPLTFFKSLAKKSQLGDVMLFSIPDLYNYLKKNFVNTINFEHTYFITDDVADFLVKKTGYDLIEKFNFNEHSIFYAIRYVGIDKIKNDDLIINKYFEYKKMYLNFINYIDNEVLRINKSMNEYIIKNKDSKIYLFGAHIFSQFLINRGLQTDKINAIIDNSLAKIGKRLYGTDLNVISPNNLNDSSSLIILKAGQYQEEVERQLNKISGNLKYVI